jgi:hypothetical protein
MGYRDWDWLLFWRPITLKRTKHILAGFLEPKSGKTYNSFYRGEVYASLLKEAQSKAGNRDLTEEQAMSIQANIRSSATRLEESDGVVLDNEIIYMTGIVFVQGEQLKVLKLRHDLNVSPKAGVQLLRA